MRLRDIGDADLCGASGVAIACRVAASIQDGDDGTRWSGQVWPYRPLALTPGRYVLRVRGEDGGQVRVGASNVTGEHEVAPYTGIGAPSELVRALAASGGAAAEPKHGPRFPRVGGEVQPTALALILARVGGVIRAVLSPSRRPKSRRGWGNPRLHRLRR